MRRGRRAAPAAALACRACTAAWAATLAVTPSLCKQVGVLHAKCRGQAQQLNSSAAQWLAAAQQNRSSAEPQNCSSAAQDASGNSNDTRWPLLLCRSTTRPTRTCEQCEYCQRLWQYAAPNPQPCEQPSSLARGGGGGWAARPRFGFAACRHTPVLQLPRQSVAVPLLSNHAVVQAHSELPLPCRCSNAHAPHASTAGARFRECCSDEGGVEGGGHGREAKTIHMCQSRDWHRVGAHAVCAMCAVGPCASGV